MHLLKFRGFKKICPKKDAFYAQNVNLRKF